VTGPIIRHLDDVTPAWLTTVLRDSHALTAGEVIGFDVDAGSGNWSSNARLRVHYDPEAQGPRPERLFLKMVNTDLGDGETFGPSEVDYYLRDYVDVPDAPLLRCYSGAYAAPIHRYHLLLDDVSETHVASIDRAPTLDYGLALASGFAALHARWWGAERLADAEAPIHDAAFIERFVAIAQPGAGHIIAGLGSQLEPHWADTLQALFAGHPQALIRRTADANGFTLIHGDAGENNILVPRDDQGRIYLIDRQPFDWSLTTWLAAYDLAYAMVLDWDSETRRRLEIPVLRHYHEQLLRRGVSGYSWEQLFDDYRLSVPMCLYVVTEYRRGGLPESGQLPDWWWNMLRRSMAACDDLACRELW
jgi:hypothetical protein